MLMLSNESFESFDIRYSDTTKLLYCLAVIYSIIQISVGYIINCSSTIKSNLKWPN